MTQFTLVDSTLLVSAHASGAPSGTTLARALTRRHRLPTFVRNYGYHVASARAPISGELAQTLRWLQGKLVVVNPTLSMAVPAPLAAHVRSVVRTLARPAEGAGASGGLSATAAADSPGDARDDWLALALYEPAATVIHHRGEGTHTAGADVDVDFSADLHYRLVLFAGRGDPAGAAAAIAAGPPAATDTAPVLFFALRLYVSDDDGLRQMSLPTAALYKHITGRAARGARDRYWHLEAWERFHERGALVGCVTPTQVELSRALAASDIWRPPPSPAPSYENFLFGTSGGFEPSRWQALTPHFDRRSFIPPGYSLVEYTAWMALSVVKVG
jgi:hypothetical protein